MTSFEGAEFTRYLERNCYETRQKWKEFTKDKVFQPIFDQDILEQKQLALKRLQKLAEQKVFSYRDFKENVLNVFANHEQAGYVDGSFATKLTVQYNLFGGTVATLGSERHDHITKGVDTLDTIGCFGLTELGFGNNAIEMETTATWDEKSQEFIIDSPTVLSQKYWITNGALHSNYSIVFAQLIYKGQNEGIHCFLVPIRNKKNELCNGVWLECMGHKVGLNGVDNARIKFNKVRIPRINMLNKYSDIDEKGVYQSSIKKRRNRFLRVADRLLSGRLCIASMIISTSKLLLVVTFRYGNSRLAVDKNGKSTQPISQFNLFQNQLYPLLCKTICLNIGFNIIKDKYVEYSVKEPNQEIITLVCMIKPFITWNTKDIAGTCVERVGGQGYLSVNRLAEGIAFAHSGITAEGDNRVLMQKVTKELISMLMNKSYSLPQMSLCPTKFNQQVNTLNQGGDIIDILFQFIMFREAMNIAELQKVTMNKMKQGKDFYDVWMLEDNDIVQDVAQSYGERRVVDFCIQELRTNMKPSIKPLMQHVIQTYMLYIIQQNISQYVIWAKVDSSFCQAIQQQLKKHIQTLHPSAMSLVENFGIPEHLITAPIAQDYKAYNANSNNGEMINSKL